MFCILSSLSFLRPPPLLLLVNLRRSLQCCHCRKQETQRQADFELSSSAFSTCRFSCCCHPWPSSLSIQALPPSSLASSVFLFNGLARRLCGRRRTSVSLAPNQSSNSPSPLSASPIASPLPALRLSSSSPCLLPAPSPSSSAVVAAAAPAKEKFGAKKFAWEFFCHQ